MVAAITNLRGVEVVMQRDHGIRADDFITFLRLLKSKAGLRPVRVYLDHLSAHKTIAVRKEMVRLNIIPIWNAIYSPQWNPIELAFAKVKRVYKKEKLHRLIRGIPLNMHGIIWKLIRNK